MKVSFEHAHVSLSWNAICIHYSLPLGSLSQLCLNTNNCQQQWIAAFFSHTKKDVLNYVIYFLTSLTSQLKDQQMVKKPFYILQVPRMQKELRGLVKHQSPGYENPYLSRINSLCVCVCVCLEKVNKSLNSSSQSMKPGGG